MKLIPWIMGCIFFTMGCGSDDSDPDATAPKSSTICRQLIECARAIGAGGVTTLIATYGEDGTCWTMSGVKRSDCWAECRATMEPYRIANPDEPACRECTEASECAVFDAPYCNLEGACSDSICGNRKLEGDEVCDDPDDIDCNDDCTHDYFDCNPLNDPRPCEAGEKCDLTYDGWDVYGECVAAGSAGLYDNCDDTQCQPGYVCIVGSRVNQCPNGGPMCCTEWCDMAATSNPCPDELSCYTMGNVFSTGSDMNVMDIGYCGSSQ